MDRSPRLLVGPGERSILMAERELISPNGDKRYVRRDDEGRFGESDDVGRSLAADRRQHAATSKPRNQGDRGD